MNYRKIDINNYYRKDAFLRFSNAKCSMSMTKKIDVKELYDISKKTNTKFYINFLYIVSKVLNSVEDYKMGYLWETNELICYDKINPKHYIFHDDTKTVTICYSEFYEDYNTFYNKTEEDISEAKAIRDYNYDDLNHPNCFDLSCMPWVNYDSFNIELPDGYLYFAPIINFGKYEKFENSLLMPISMRMNHAICDGYQVSNFFVLLEKYINEFISSRK